MAKQIYVFMMQLVLVMIKSTDYVKHVLEIRF